MNRRGFLKGLGGAAAAVGAVAALPNVKAGTVFGADDFECNGYRVKWREFAEPINQSVLLGMWRAKHYTQDNEWVSTTMGQCYQSRAWEVVDLTRADGWPMLTTFSTDAERAAVKERARLALVAQL